MVEHPPQWRWRVAQRVQDVTGGVGREQEHALFVTRNGRHLLGEFPGTTHLVVVAQRPRLGRVRDHQSRERDNRCAAQHPCADSGQFGFLTRPEPVMERPGESDGDQQQHPEPARQHQPGPLRTLGRPLEEKPEAHPEEDREDRQEALVEEQPDEIRQLGHRPGAPDHDELLVDVDDEDAAEREPAERVERVDAGTGCRDPAGGGPRPVGGVHAFQRAMPGVTDGSRPRDCRGMDVLRPCGGCIVDRRGRLREMS